MPQLPSSVPGRTQPSSSLAVRVRSSLEHMRRERLRSKQSEQHGRPCHRLHDVMCLRLSYHHLCQFRDRGTSSTASPSSRRFSLHVDTLPTCQSSCAQTGLVHSLTSLITSATLVRQATRWHLSVGSSGTSSCTMSYSVGRDGARQVEVVMSCSAPWQIASSFGDRESAISS